MRECSLSKGEIEAAVVLAGMICAQDIKDVLSVVVRQKRLVHRINQNRSGQFKGGSVIGTHFASPLIQVELAFVSPWLIRPAKIRL